MNLNNSSLEEHFFKLANSSKSSLSKSEESGEFLIVFNENKHRSLSWEYNNIEDRDSDFDYINEVRDIVEKSKKAYR